MTDSSNTATSATPGTESVAALVAKMNAQSSGGGTQPTSGAPLTTEGHGNCLKALGGEALHTIRLFVGSVKEVGLAPTLATAIYGAAANHTLGRWQRQVEAERAKQVQGVGHEGP